MVEEENHPELPPEPRQEPHTGLFQLLKDANQFLDSPVGRVIQKQAGLDTSKGEKELHKYKAYRLLYALRDFLNDTVLTVAIYVAIIIVFLWLRKVLGV